MILLSMVQDYPETKLGIKSNKANTTFPKQAQAKTGFLSPKIFIHNGRAWAFPGEI